MQQQKSSPPADRHFRIVADLSPNGVITIDRDSVIVYANPRVHRILGCAPGTLPGRSMTEFLAPDQHPAHHERIRRSLDPAAEPVEWHDLRLELRDAQGAAIPISISIAHAGEDGRELFTGIVRDLRPEIERLEEMADLNVELETALEESGKLYEQAEAARVEAEAARREAESLAAASRELEARYRLLFDRNPHPMWVFDRDDLRFLAVNQAAVEHYGWSLDEFLAMTIAEIRPPEDRPRLRTHIADPARGADAGVWTHLRRDGSRIAAQIHSRDIDFAGRAARIVLAIDVTQQRSLEEQLRRTQKLEAIGRLAGGVAHDFNNILTVIQGHASFLEEARLDDESMESVHEILDASRSASRLIGQLLTFGRRQVVAPEPLDLNQAVHGVSSMLRRLIRENIELDFDLDRAPAIVHADRGQIDQLIVNLAINAAEAIDARGTVSIRTRVRTVDHPDSVLLEVADTGRGMDADTLDHLFEPFFTTRPTGTGLGLATVHGIVTQNGGTIDVASTPGLGTIFRLRLPRTDP